MKKTAIMTLCLFFSILSGAYAQTEYDPQIDPKNFSKNITNPYLVLPAGKKLIYESKTKDGSTETIEIDITGESKVVMGVETLVYHDRVWLNGVLTEDTRDYLAQDNTGNVWYFGEDVDNYMSGKLANHEGSWLSGVDGAKPGIWIKSDHRVGDSYRQEYYPGEAEDMRDVVSVDRSVETKNAKYNHCVQMYDWTPLDPESKEYKYYCQEVGAMVLEDNVTNGRKTELIQVSNSGVDTISDTRNTGMNSMIFFGIVVVLAAIIMGYILFMKK